MAGFQGSTGAGGEKRLHPFFVNGRINKGVITMILTFDTLDEIYALFPGGKFDFSRWEQYADRWFGGDSHLFRDDMEEAIGSGNYSYERDYLPVIQGVYQNIKLLQVRRFFSNVTERLDEKVKDNFGEKLDVDIVLYLGLCNGAGWAVSLNGREKVLLGIEKILELGWTGLMDLQGLVYHELGHLYHIQHGFFHQAPQEGPRRFVWQLFAEGIAMCFEQVLVGDWEFYQQDKGGWRAWCRKNHTEILQNFDRDLPVMSRGNQRYFGDWVSYKGHGDTGYFLGAKWVQSLLLHHSFQEVIQLPLESVCKFYKDYVEEVLGVESNLQF